MLRYSKQHNFKTREDVQQVLVFSCDEVCKHFETNYAKEVFRVGKSMADDTNMGAIYKLQACRKLNGRWTYTLKCGFTDAYIVNNMTPDYPTAEIAIQMCAIKLKKLLEESVRT